MTSSSTVFVPTTQELAALLKAAADPLRLEVLRVLAKDSYGVLELCHIFQMKQSGMSHHLKVLANADLVTTRREGNSIFYRRSTASPNLGFAELRRALQLGVDELLLQPEIKQRVAQVHATRSDAARDFFAEFSPQFREKQDLIAAFDVYGPQVTELLTSSVFSTENTERARALEIGPGEGEFLKVLAERFNSVTALDITEAMLQKAREYNKHFDNIEYVCDDTQWCRQRPNGFDCIVINMVLHHTPSPQQIFTDAASSLKPGGALLICDLCRHEQDWVKTACGDLWFGFEPDELQQWANDNQLTENHSTYFALRNGFQIQIQLFKKN